jgi:hypothetical protein
MSTVEIELGTFWLLTYIPCTWLAYKLCVQSVSSSIPAAVPNIENEE